MRVLRANIETGALAYKEVPTSWQKVGGRALVARFLLDEVPPTCDPLGPENKLIWAPGLLTGHMLSSLDRIAVGGKSPLTGGAKESNGGGSTAMRMVWLRLFALIVEGGPPADGKWRLLIVDPEGARFEDASDLAGLGLVATGDRLAARFGPKIGISAIGTGGERLYHSAGITHLDKDRNLTRISARGGLGAVMGSKRLKAVVFDLYRSNQPEPADPALFKDASRRYLRALQDHPQTGELYPKYGTAAMVSLCNTLGGIPTRNFSAGRFEGAEKISGEAVREINLARGGEPTHACMQGCIIRCSNVYAGPDGSTLVTPLEDETIGLMGSNLGLDDTDDIARLNAIANDVGVDTIEIGAALGVAAEAGCFSFGDGAGALRLMEELRDGTPLGRILGAGAGVTGKVLGVRRVPVVKNQAISAYDPRAIKGTGVTYATSAQGADHTSGLTIRAQVDHTDPQGQVALSRGAQYRMAGYDSLGACIFAGFALDATLVRDLIRGRHGWDVTDTFLTDLGRESVLMERQFNRTAGLTPADDRLPEWMTTEELPDVGTAFDVPPADMDAIFD
jgi:aldehyde:ferredoxin oxidoreductase